MHGNNSSAAVSTTSHYQVLSFSLMSSLVVLITVGNVLSLTIFLGSRRFHTPQGYLKVSLASADLAVGVVVVPYSLFHEIDSLWTSSQQGQSSVTVSGQTNISDDEVSVLEGGGFQPCFVMGPVFAGCTLVSITTIFLLSLERGITILKPLQKNVIVTKQRTLGLIAVTWLLCSVMAVSPLLMSKDVTLAFSSCSKMCNYVPCSAQQGLLCPPENPPDNNSSCGSSVSMAMLVFPIFDLAMIAATCVVNAVTFSAVRRFCCGHSQPAVVRRKWFTKASSSMEVSTSGPSFSDIRAAKTIAVLTAFFCASLLPVAVLVLGNVLLGRRWCRFSLYAFWSLACSSGWNVLIYSTCDRRFRQRTTELLWRAREKRKKKRSRSRRRGVEGIPRGGGGGGGGGGGWEEHENGIRGRKRGSWWWRLHHNAEQCHAGGGCLAVVGGGGGRAQSWYQLDVRTPHQELTVSTLAVSPQGSPNVAESPRVNRG